MTEADRSFLADVFAEARTLGLAWWERVAFIVALAVLLVVGKRLGSVFGRALTPIGPPPPKPPDQPDVSDPEPVSEWGKNVAPNTEPGGPMGGG